MSRNFKKVLEAIPEEDVANYRMNNKKVDLSEDIKARNLLSGDYWKYIYTAKCIYKYHFDSISSSRNNLDILHNYVEEDSYTLRCIINAIACKLAGEKTSFPLETLSTEEFQAAKKLYVFSSKFGYYFWDIDNVCNPKDLIDFFIKNNSMPLPPLPFCSNQEQRARVITYRLFSGSIFTGRESFVEEMENKEFHLPISFKFKDANFEKNLKNASLEQKMTCLAVEQTTEGEPKSTNEVTEFINMRKCLVPDQFHADSIAARCIGLLMYDAMLSSGEDIDATIHSFKSTKIYQTLSCIRLFKKSNNAFISDKDNGTLKRWLKITQNCIDKMSVLSLK